MTKVFLATPAYDGKVNVQYAISLGETYNLLKNVGIDVQTAINCSGSLLVAERNRLLEQFMDSDCTHILCIDSDLGWPAQSVLAMIHHEKDFVGGVYPTRRDNLFLFRPVLKEDGSLETDGKKLMKMEYIPSGFIMLTRDAVKKMRGFFPHLFFKPKESNNDPSRLSGYALFNTEVWEGEFWGEDYVFCRRVREAGIDIWVDPMIEFDHCGVRGMLAQCLTDKKPGE